MADPRWPRLILRHMMSPLMSQTPKETILDALFARRPKKPRLNTIKMKKKLMTMKCKFANGV